MKSYIDKKKAEVSPAQMKKSGQPASAQRPEQETLQLQQAAADNSPMASRLEALQAMANQQTSVNIPTTLPKTIPIQRRYAGRLIQKKDDEQQKPISANENEVAPGKEKTAPVAAVPDAPTLTDQLKSMAADFLQLGSPEKTAADFIQAGLIAGETTAKAGGAGSSLASGIQKGASKTTENVKSGFEGFTEAFAAIKNGFQAIRKVVDIVKNNQDYSTAAKAKQAAEAGMLAMDSAKGVLSSVKAFIEMVNGAASGGLAASIPGLDIAISAGKIIMDGYYLAVSNSSRKTMNNRREEIAKEKGKSQQELEQDSEKFRTNDAKIANYKKVIADEEIRVKEQEQGKKGMFDWMRRPTPLKDRKLRLEKLRLELQQLETEAKTEANAREDVAEFTLATELRDANYKRVVRQSIHIAAEIAKIAGSVTSLTGVGAAAGTAVKGAAEAVEGSAGLLRSAKQAGRDRDARKMIKGSASSAHFDVTKSTEAKKAFREQQVNQLIRMITGINKLDAKAQDAKAKQIKAYLNASGVDIDKLFKKKGEPKAQIELLVKAINQREFSE
jgi:hypothetical protein